MKATKHVNTLKHHRRQRGLTQAGLARKVGISEQHYQNLEYGKAKPKYDTLRKLAYELGATETELFPLPGEAQKKTAKYMTGGHHG